MKDRSDRELTALSIALLTNCSRVNEYGRTWAVRPMKEVSRQLGISPRAVMSHIRWLDSAEERLIGVENVEGVWRTFVSVENPMLQFQVRLLSPRWEESHG